MTEITIFHVNDFKNPYPQIFVQFLLINCPFAYYLEILKVISFEMQAQKIKLLFFFIVQRKPNPCDAFFPFVSLI